MHKSKKLPLVIDVGTQLKIEVVGFEGRYNCNLIGIKPDDYLIIEAPPTNVSKQLQEGATVIVRYVYFGNIFGFKSKMLKFVSTPFNLLFLSYPEAVEKHNLRKEARIQCHIPSKASVQDKEAQGVIVDISVSGCQYVINMSKVDLSTVIKLEDKIALTFPFFGMETSLTVAAKILHINCDNGNMFLGLRFEGLDSKTLNTIENYIDDVSDQIP